MRVKQEIFSEPFCEYAEFRYFEYLLDMVVARRDHEVVIKPVVHAVFNEKGSSFFGHVIWKDRHYGEETGLCISGISAGYLVTNGPLRIDIGRVLAMGGEEFYAKIAEKMLVDTHDLEETLATRLRDIVVSGKDGALASALVVLLTEVGYPVDADRFMENVLQKNLRQPGRRDGWVDEG